MVDPDDIDSEISPSYYTLAAVGIGQGGTMISRTGHASLRKALYRPGLVALRHNRYVQAMAQMWANA